jgi:hypothetical protein
MSKYWMGSLYGALTAWRDQVMEERAERKRLQGLVGKLWCSCLRVAYLAWHEHVCDQKQIGRAHV